MGGVRGTVFENVVAIGWIDGLSSAGLLGGAQQMLFSTPFSGGGIRRSVNIANGNITAQAVGAGQALGNASVFVNDVLTAYTCAQGATPTLYRGANAFSTGPAGVGFNQCNDLIVHSGGTVWVTDPAGYNNTSKPAQATSGIFRISADGATVVKVRDFGNLLDRPNGIAFSPDEKTLYVSLTNAGKVVAYPVANDLSLGVAADFVTGLTEPDGLAVDDNGNVYVTTSPGGAGAVNVYKADKTFWGKIDIPKIPVVTVGFGGADRRTLFIGTGGTDGASGLYKFPTNVAGKL
jgi:gluconolactonase